jgi:RNA polymerase sigma factor (sigma-70 family)
VRSDDNPFSRDHAKVVDQREELLTDDELLARAGRDPACFELLVGRLSDDLHAYLSRRAPSAADDLLSEAWLAAFAGRRTYDKGRGSARAWLFAIARNVLHAYWRKSAALALLPTDPQSDSLVESYDVWVGVDARLDAAAVAPQLREGLRALPGVDRELFLLVAWEQLTPTEAAVVVGVPAGTARSRLHRARTRLREHLEVSAGLGRLDALSGRDQKGTR